MVRIVKPVLTSALLVVLSFAQTIESPATDLTDPETAIRTLVRANAEKDIATLSRLMAHDADITSYTIGGRKYVGWPDFEREMREEFDSVQKLEIPIQELRVWTKGDLAWFAMELDYIRFVETNSGTKRTVIPLRETGVLERREGQWVLLSWHESFRTAQLGGPLANQAAPAAAQHLVSNMASPVPDLSGNWEILEVEDDKHYTATLDRSGNGPYTQHGGRFVTTKYADRLWQGTWQQPGNDREGGFEVLLSEDGTQAKGVWWYTRVGTQKNIPPREHGGTYIWKRLNQPPTTQ